MAKIDKFIKREFDRESFIEHWHSIYYKNMTEEYNNSETPAEDIMHDYLYDCIIDMTNCIEELINEKYL